MDTWSVTLSKGQTLSASIDANRIGSPLEGEVEVRNPTGKVIAEAVASPGKDPRIQATAPADGVYQVSITDARADGGPAFVYRLTLSSQAIAERSPTIVLRTVRESDTPDPVRGNFLNVPAIGEGRISGPRDRPLGILCSQRRRPGSRPARQPARLATARRVGDRGLGRQRVDAGRAGSSAGGHRSIFEILGPFGRSFLCHGSGSVSKPWRAGIQVSPPSFAADAGVRFELLAASALALRGLSKCRSRLTARRHGSFNGPITVAVDGLPAGISVPRKS